MGPYRFNKKIILDTVFVNVIKLDQNIKMVLIVGPL